MSDLEEGEMGDAAQGEVQQLQENRVSSNWLPQVLWNFFFF